ncbi:alpha/beta hydrolase [soil metagenome]
MDDVDFEPFGGDLRLAYLLTPGRDGKRCGCFWLGGFRSDMTGTKAEAVAAFAEASGRTCLRFDYSGHGQSGGDFERATMSGWLAQSLHMLRTHMRGPCIVAGSSMGGWLAMLLLRALGSEADRIKGLVLLAPAADMTERLMWDAFPPPVRETILTEGVWYRPSAYGDGPYPITRALIEDGRKHLLLDKAFPVSCPVRILHGDADADVPWQHGLEIHNAIAGEDVRFTLIKGGDHRLSSPRDLDLLTRTIGELAAAGDDSP